jgi:plasmid stabilization system protein ParE
MHFRVELTEKANRDLDGILEWLLEQQAGETGLRWFWRLEEACESLSQLPRRCGVAPEDAEFPFEVRQLLYGNKPHLYRILFTIEGDNVIILHVLHGRRLSLKR